MNVSIIQRFSYEGKPVNSCEELIDFAQPHKPASGKLGDRAALVIEISSCRI
jgi:hypothetical protein